MLVAIFTSATLLCGGSSLSACANSIAPTPESDITITPEQFGTTVTVKIGDTISIAWPTDSENWRVDFASPPLELLNPPEKQGSPGSSMWRFRAVASGESDIVLTLVTAGDASPPRFAVTVKISS